MKNLILVLVLFAFSGCSMFSSQEVTPETKMAVLRLCDEYLRNLANGKASQAEAMIAWSDYAPASEDELTREEFDQIIKSKKDRWSKEEHPLLGLDVTDVEIGNDVAVITLVKKSTKSTIEIKLNWVGRGWVVTGDNILSKNGIYRRNA